MREANATGRGDLAFWNNSNQKRSQPSNLDRSGTDSNDQAALATAMATVFEPLNKSLKTFLTRLSRTSERNEKSRRVFKKPRCYKDKSNGCMDTWIEVTKLRFEEEDTTEKQECIALTSNLEVTALNFVMAKKQYQRYTAEKIFEILLNRFGTGVQGHQAMMRSRNEDNVEKNL